MRIRHPYKCNRRPRSPLWYGEPHLFLKDIVNHKGTKYVWFARIFAAIASGILELSIALLFLRIVKMKRVYRYIIYFTIAVNRIVTFIWVLMTFKCIHPSHNWDRTVAGSCIADDIETSYAWFAGSPCLSFPRSSSHPNHYI